MRRLLLVVSFMVLIVGCGGDPIESSFKTGVTKYWNSFQEKNWEKAVSYFFQAKILALGGMDGAVSAMESAMEPMTITDWDLVNVQVMHDHDDIYIGVAEIVFEADRKSNGEIFKLKSETGLIGHTDNKGKTWHFVGVTPEERNLVGTMVPDLFQTLDVPKEQLYVKEGGDWKPLNVK